MAKLVQDEETGELKPHKEPRLPRAPAGHFRCVECKGIYPVVEVMTINSKKYCQTCGPRFRKEADTNIALNDFLYQICDENKDAMPFLTHQVKMLKDFNEWKAESILTVLQYIYGKDSVLHYEYNPEYGIKSLVEKYYPIVKELYMDKKDLQDKFPDEAIMEILTMPPRIITINRSHLIAKERELNEKKKNAIYGPPIDLDILPDEDNYEEE